MSHTGSTLLFGLIGDPVAHSLSPFIMNRAFQNISIDAVYVAFGIRPAILNQSIGGLRALGAMGLNITYPYKQEVLYQLDVVTSDAELIDAVNTVMIFDDEIHGYNTDAPGTALALETFADVTLEGNRAFIYGAGGSARAAAYGLLESGVERLTLGVRSADRVQTIIEAFQFAFPEQLIDFVILDDPTTSLQREEAFRESGVVINATPVGMAGVASGELIEDVSWIGSHQCFFDFVYHPRQTSFLNTARENGAKTLGGIALLIAQAAESFRLWTDRSFDIEEMAQAVELFSSPGADSGGLN